MRFAILAFLVVATVLPWPTGIRCNGAMGDEPNRESQTDGATQDEDADEKPSASAASVLMSLASKTGGGTQLWTDHVHREGYRIQQNSLTGHWRLLDSKNIRQCWGSRETCESKLDEICPHQELDSPKHVIVLLHGLMRTRGSMKPVEAMFIEESYPEVVRFSYASTRASIRDHAAALRSVLENMPDDTQFSFVGHSMGNIVVRHMLGDLNGDDPEMLLDRCRSMVMLGPPNQGAAIARRLATTGIFGIVTGKGGMELGPKWQELEERLGVPSFPFAIIAGDLSDSAGGIKNPLVDGSSDLVVSVDEAQLEGAEWIRTVPVLHSVLMNDEEVHEMALEFIQKH